MKLKRIFQTIGLATKKTVYKRGKYLRKKNILQECGDNVYFQPRLIPLYPKLIKLHNNIMIAAGVRFLTHDASYRVLKKLGQGYFPEKIGCIEIMDNVFIGCNALIMNNVRIGKNVVVGAGAVVTKDLEENGVYVGCPARKIGTFDDFVKRMDKDENGNYSYPFVKHNQDMQEDEIEAAWKFFYDKRTIVR